MPAPFVLDLCRFRAKDGKPNTSDGSNSDSVRIGNALFEVLGVPRESRGDEPTGTPFAKRTADDLRTHAIGSLVIEAENQLNRFQQYRHVGALADIDVEPSKDYTRAWKKLKAEAIKRVASPPAAARRIADLIEQVESATRDETVRRQRALYEVGSESLLRLDVTGALPSDSWLPELKVGLSLKWSLRTDRAQDCRSQGANLSALRRGRMPHFAAVTMEPRPYMLNLLGGGSGDIDCVYHLDLPALTAAINETYGASTRADGKRTHATFHRLVEQRRLRDYDELASYIARW